MKRRQYLAAVGVATAGALAGCSGGSGAEVSGTVRDPDNSTHNVDVESGQTLRVEVENTEGPMTAVRVNTPDGDRAIDDTVDTEATFTHTAESTGAYRVTIVPTGSASYEIHIDTDG